LYNVYLKKGTFIFHVELDFKSQEVEKKNKEVVSKIKVEYVKNTLDETVSLLISKTAIIPMHRMLKIIPHPQIL
jgi:uncharacterized protein (UPF0248 family)